MTKVTLTSGGATVVQYKYNGLNYQIGRHADLDADADVDNTDKWEWTVYDPQWRRAATIMVAGGSAFTGSADTSVAADRIKERYVHHAAGRFGRGSYIDSVILRDRDQTNGNNGAADGTLEQRLYYCQNWRADVSVTMTDSGRILEWLKYSAYGVCQRIPMADFNHDAFVDSFDDNDFGTAYGLGSADADINYDGATNSTDNSQWNTTYAEQGYTSRGVLAESGGSAPVSRLGYAGYWFEPATQQYLVRNRELDPLVGVWDERDPLEYHDGPATYAYSRSSPVSESDPLGLAGTSCFSGLCGGSEEVVGGIEWIRDVWRAITPLPIPGTIGFLNCTPAQRDRAARLCKTTCASIGQQFLGLKSCDVVRHREWFMTVDVIVPECSCSSPGSWVAPPPRSGCTNQCDPPPQPVVHCDHGHGRCQPPMCHWHYFTVHQAPSDDPIAPCKCRTQRRFGGCVWRAPEDR